MGTDGGSLRLGPGGCCWAGGLGSTADTWASAGFVRTVAAVHVSCDPYSTQCASDLACSCVFCCCGLLPPPPAAADKPFTEEHGYSAVPPASPASFRRQQQLQHMRQQRQQHNMEREERCLAGDAPAAAAAAGGSRARGKGSKAQNAQQQARIKHNQGVKASANVSEGRLQLAVLLAGRWDAWSTPQPVAHVCDGGPWHVVAVARSLLSC